MRVCIQRVANASVTVADQVVASIKKGIVVLVGIGRDDTPKHAQAMIKKILGVRLWPEQANPDRTWATGVAANGYEVLLVSQFTMYGYLKGHKPDFHEAMPPAQAKAFYEDFVGMVKRAYEPSKVQSGIFAADMRVDISNDGPVTLVLESPQDPPTKPPKDAAARPSPSASPSVDVSEGSESKGEDAVAAADAPAAAAAGPEPGTAAALAAAAAHASSPVPKAEGPQP